MRKKFQRTPSAANSWRATYALGCLVLAGSCQGAAASSAKDLGGVALTTPLSATVVLKGARHADFDAAVASLYDTSSPTYHQWMSASDVAAYGLTSQELALATASLTAQGLHVERVSTDGSMVKVSGPASAFQTAFGTSIHEWSSNGAVRLKTTSTPTFKGTHPELVAGISGLNSSGARPFFLRQTNFATGQAVAAVTPQAGTDPLASFTTDCFKSKASLSISGYVAKVGAVAGSYTGTSYLSMDVKNEVRPACGYTAKQVAAHYGIDQVQALGWTGKGETIVIVDAYGSPTIMADANAFSQTMGLPKLNEKSLQIVFPDGQPANADVGWGGETSLDVEWAHALAPDANIVLVVAPTEDNAELAYAVEYAVEQRLGSVISNSWGLPEAEADVGTARMFNQVFKKAAARGISVNVATGDSGDNGVGAPVGAPNIPSDSPFATAVGGTSINVPSDNGPVEAAWGITVSSLGTSFSPAPAPALSGTGFAQGSGGGESVYMEKPRFQRMLPGTGRQVPDVSSLADPQTGAISVQTDPTTGAQVYFSVGGTSLATPLFSAIWTLANQAAGEPLGQAAPILGQLPNYAIRDVLPISAKHINASGFTTVQARTVSGFQAPVTYTYDPDQMLGLSEGTGGFVGTLFWSSVNAVALPAYFDLGFGLDSSLAAAQGWDNATGYGVPNGLLFVDAVRQFVRHMH